MFSRIHHPVSSFFTLMTLASFVLLIGCSGQSPLAPTSETGADKPTAEKPGSIGDEVSFDIPEDEDMGEEDVESEPMVKPTLRSGDPYMGDDDEVPGDVGAYNYSANIAEIDTGDE